jgi:hypothetical protein
MSEMKYLFFLSMIWLSGSCRSLAQDNLIAVRNGGEYELAISKKDFATIFETDIAPVLNAGSDQRYVFEDLQIDDPVPNDLNSHAYVAMRASSKRETVTIGLILIKEVVNEQITRLYIPSLAVINSGTPDQSAGEAGWKCTSNKSDCGGCRRVRENGVVVACPCVGGDGYCNFEITGGGGNNWPDWLTALILALLRVV